MKKKKISSGGEKKISSGMCTHSLWKDICISEDLSFQEVDLGA